MQTFHTNVDFRVTAQELDRQRLGNQRVETLQIVKALATKRGWIHHPATKMWEGRVGYLIQYGYAVIDEWEARGYEDSVRSQLAGFSIFFEDSLSMSEPLWWRDTAVILSHKSNLVRKNPEHYRYDVPNNLPYLWPMLTDEGYELSLSKADQKRVKRSKRTLPATIKERVND